MGFVNFLKSAGKATSKVLFKNISHPFSRFGAFLAEKGINKDGEIDYRFHTSRLSKRLGTDFIPGDRKKDGLEDANIAVPGSLLPVSTDDIEKAIRGFNLEAGKDGYSCLSDIKNRNLLEGNLSDKDKLGKLLDSLDVNDTKLSIKYDFKSKKYSLKVEIDLSKCDTKEEAIEKIKTTLESMGQDPKNAQKITDRLWKAEMEFREAEKVPYGSEPDAKSDKTISPILIKPQPLHQREQINSGPSESGVEEDMHAEDRSSLGGSGGGIQSALLNKQPAGRQTEGEHGIDRGNGSGSVSIDSDPRHLSHGSSAPPTPNPPDLSGGRTKV